MLPSPCNGCGQIQPCLMVSRIEDPTTDLSYFDEEFIRVGAQIHQLIRLQARLLGGRNRRRSPIYTLPVELLSAIFLCACTSSPDREGWQPSTKFNRQVIVLSSVSSHWRQIVFQTPKLWDTVTLEINEDTAGSGAALLYHCLQHTKNIDVTVDIKLDNKSRMRNRALYYQSVADILFTPENAHRIKILRLENPPVEWLANLSQLLRVHTLRLESLESGDNTPVNLHLHTQSLHELFLGLSWPCQLGSVNLPPSLQTLVTDVTLPDINLALLRQCPNLVGCYNHRPLPMPCGSITTPLTLDRLEFLTWSANEGFGDITSVQNLRLPAIKHLRLISVADEPAVPIITFCRQHSGTLKSLELEGFSSWQAGDVGRLLHHTMPHLEELRLNCWPLSQLIEAVSVLTPSNEEFAHNEVKVLPCLQSLMLCDFEQLDGELARALNLLPCRSGDDVADMIDMFLKMLERRRAGQFTQFLLDLPPLWDYDRKLTWSTELQGRLRRAIEGRHIEVLQDSEVLEWLL